MERYGGAIRADLRAEYGVDVLDVFRDGMSVDAALDFIDGLPQSSRFSAAVADDDDFAALFGDVDDAAKPGPPRMTEWSPEVAALVALIDRVEELIGVQVARAGKRPPARPPYPRPVTAMERVKKRRSAQRHRDLVARVLPPKT